MAVIQGNTSGNVAEVDSTNRLKVNLATAANPSEIGAITFFSENDDGTKLGTPYLASPETDDDARLRVAQESLFDCETFNYTAQNTGKHIYRTTTMTNTWTTAGMTTNSGNITTTGTSTSFSTYAEFPSLGVSLLYCETQGSFTAAPATNTVVDFGMFRPSATAPYAPGDGFFFRLTAAGLSGVISYNGTETTTSVFDFTYNINEKYQFIIAAHETEVEFWIDETLYGRMVTPAGQGQPYMSASLPFSVRHALTGTAGAALSFVLNDYAVSIGGPNMSLVPSTMGLRIYGSYQGLSGGTMGTLATYPNSANPTAAAPSNTALTANLPAGLGGQGLVNAAAASATDGIWGSYQIPAGTTSIQGRRLVLRGVKVDAVNLGAAVATSATTLQFSLAFGHTAVSLGTTETATTKAPRRVAVGFMTWPIGAAIGAGPQGGSVVLDLGDAPIFVNPGEFIQLVAKFISGTATASQTIQFIWQPIYGWE
jgi:hypothetical protein